MTEDLDRQDEVAQRRRVQPVPDEPDPEEVFDPESSARPALAVWLSVGPVLLGLGVAGWMVLLSGVRREKTLEWNAGALALDGALLLIFLLVRTGLARGWGREHRGLSRFDLIAGTFIPYALATSLMVIATANTIHGEDFVGTRLAPVEAAQILGASKWRIFWEIQVPLLRPVILLALILLLGAVVGAQIGTKVGSYLKGEQLRGLLALMVLAVCMKLAYDLVATPADVYSLGLSVGH